MKLKTLKQNWAQASIKSGATAADQYEADDIIKTDPSGGVTDKAQGKMELSSGNLKFESVELSHMTVHVRDCSSEHKADIHPVRACSLMDEQGCINPSRFVLLP